MKRTEGAVDPTLTPSQVETVKDPSSGNVSTIPVGEDAPLSIKLPAGYAVKNLIGRGGMGEVVLAEDLRIGRSVAIKSMRSARPSDELVARFWREAKIQARLDHPAIVPVHELGHDLDGRPYFTMKRLAGTTLAEVLAARKVTQQKLLRAFVDVCIAIEFAHAHKVIHRDVKPANIVLGDYGEVYMLDWGVARVLGEHEPSRVDDIASLEGETQAGALLGTPGYMSPEQMKGDPIGPPTDVYALGAILFEILTGESLHPKGHGAIASTLAGVESQPAKRLPDAGIAPELDAACAAALAAEPGDRPTAGQLADRVQRYLDGDRDLEHRRELAAEQLAVAQEAAGDHARRGEAMQRAGRALALDPESKEAAALVMRLMLEPPQQLPPSLVAQIDASELELTRRQSKLAALAVMSYLAFLPLLVWTGVRDWWLIGGSVAVIASLIGVAYSMSRTREPPVLLGVGLNTLLLILFSRIVTPILVLPGLASAIGFTLLTIPQLTKRFGLVMAAMLGAVAVPLVLEATGVWARTWEIAGGVLRLYPSAIRFDGIPAQVFVVCVNLGMIAVSLAFAWSLTLSRRDATRRLEIHAWHLGQLLPVEPPRAPAPAPACTPATC